MSEIKFRAYFHKRDEKSNGGFMLYSEGVHDGEPTEKGYAYTRIIPHAKKAWENETWTNFWRNFFAFCYKVTLMLYTGLRDKNGKEIFDGDIVLITLHFKDVDGEEYNTKIIKTKIRYSSGSFWYEGEGYTDCNWHFYNREDIEVIGNIYENPELLEVTA